LVKHGSQHGSFRVVQRMSGAGVDKIADRGYELHM